MVRASTVIICRGPQLHATGLRLSCPLSTDYSRAVPWLHTHLHFSHRSAGDIEEACRQWSTEVCAISWQSLQTTREVLQCWCQRASNAAGAVLQGCSLAPLTQAVLTFEKSSVAACCAVSGQTTCALAVVQAVASRTMASVAAAFIVNGA